MNVSSFANFGAQQAVDRDLMRDGFLERIQLVAVIRGSSPCFVQ
jgi:hypothetical protein